MLSMHQLKKEISWLPQGSIFRMFKVKKLDPNLVEQEVFSTGEQKLFSG